MNLSDYLLSQDGHDWPSLLAEWAEVFPPEFTIWIVNRLGDLVVVLPDGSVHLLNVGLGSLKRIADSREHFVNAIDEGDNASQWFAIPLVDACVAPDGHPKLLHPWPVKLLQAGRGDYAVWGVMAKRAAASLRR